MLAPFLQIEEIRIIFQDNIKQRHLSQVLIRLRFNGAIVNQTCPPFNGGSFCGFTSQSINLNERSETKETEEYKINDLS